MTTPKQLQRFADDQGLSYERLARAISAAAGYDISTSAIFRFCAGQVTPARRMRNAIEKFMAAQRTTTKEARA